MEKKAKELAQKCFGSKCDCLPQLQKATLVLAQSEKVKSGIIWTQQALLLAGQLPDAEKTGALRIVRFYLSQIANEIQLAFHLTQEDYFKEAGKQIDSALVMFDSGVGADASPRLVQALSMVTSAGQNAYSTLSNQVEENDRFSS